MHIKEEQLQEWEQGKSFPNDEQLDRLATLFQVSVSELCDADESSDKQKKKQPVAQDKKEKKQKVKKGKTKKKTKRKTRHKTKLL